MRKHVYLLNSLIFILGISVNAQCPDGIAIKNITLPSTCSSSDGKFTINVTPAQTPALYESSSDGGITWFAHTVQANTKTALPAGLYKIIIRDIATQTVCTTRDFVLSSNYPTTPFTATPTAATGCNTPDGQIVLSGTLSTTDSISWLSSIKPIYTKIGDIAANTISNLKPGVYYIIAKSPSSDYCFSTQIITIANSGTACPAATLCPSSYGENKFPNGDFGAGASLNGPALPANETAYPYTLLAHNSPNDGFYTIANTTDYNGAGGKVFDKWIITTDHTGNTNGYMMLVNASYAQDIVTEKTITGLCPNKTYQFSAWVQNLKPTETSAIKPNLAFLIDGVGKFATGDVTGTGWVNIGFTFKSSSTSAKVSIRNNNPGGSGNDWAIDDILISVCSPSITMIPVAGDCINPATTISSTVNDISQLYDKYKWQVDKKDGNGFVDAPNGNGAGTFDASHQYTATLVPTPSPLTNFQDGWVYRLVLAEDVADFLNADCNFVNTQTLIISNCGVMLPIKISSLKAVLTNTTEGTISFSVQEQADIKQYQLEKSVDGINYSLVNTITASSAINYAFVDNSINNEINYYRIKAINKDGKYYYSSTATILVKGNTNKITIFPNPVKDRLFIWTPTNTKIKAVAIVDAIGQIIIQKFATSSTNISDIEVGKLPIGVYNIQIRTSKNEVKNFSFIKK